MQGIYILCPYQKKKNPLAVPFKCSKMLAILGSHIKEKIPQNDVVLALQTLAVTRARIMGKSWQHYWLPLSFIGSCVK